MSEDQGQNGPCPALRPVRDKLSMDYLNTCAKCWARGVPQVLWEHKGVGPHLSLTRVEGEHKRKHRVHSNQEVGVGWGSGEGVGKVPTGRRDHVRRDLMHETT